MQFLYQASVFFLIRLFHLFLPLRTIQNQKLLEKEHKKGDICYGKTELNVYFYNPEIRNI